MAYDVVGKIRRRNMQTQYENQGGLLVIPGTNQCAGYILNFEGHGAYHPIGKVETPQGPTKDEIDAHNAILAKAELDHAIEAGKATFYLSWDQGQGGTQSNYRVSNWVGSWKSPHCYVRRGYSYGFGRFEAFWIWFTGPDGKQWYGALKGDRQCFDARRLKRNRGNKTSFDSADTIQLGMRKGGEGGAMTPIMGVLTIYHSRRDMYGNVYYAVSLANDRFEVVASGTIASDNVNTRDCREQLGWHIERVEMPIRDYKGMVKKWPYYGCRWNEIKANLVRG